MLTKNNKIFLNKTKKLNKLKKFKLLTKKVKISDGLKDFVNWYKKYEL